MKHDLLDSTGKKLPKKIDLPDEIFAATIKPSIMALYTRVYLARARQNTKATKRKKDLSDSTAKIWRQKGTGRARHGSRRAPIFVGGAKAHGPTGTENYKLRLNKKTRRLALYSALTSKLPQTVFISNLDTSATSTKHTQLALKKTNTLTPGKITTIVLDDSSSPLIRFTKNIPGVQTTQASRLNPYEVSLSDHFIFSPASLQTLTQTFLKSSAPSPTATKPEKPQTTPKSTKPTTTKAKTKS